jgi:hypothetical protein
MEGRILRICLMLAIILIAMANGEISDKFQPLSEFASSREISAQEIMANANISHIIYDHVIIKDDLFFNVDQYNPVKITNSVFLENVSFQGITFHGDVDFNNTTFQKNAVFDGTKFMAEANFNSSRFQEDASFNMSSFPDGGNFDFAYFGGVADFANVWFDKFASFYNATFKGDIQFPFSEFNGAYVNFESAQCLKDTDFSGSQFNSYATFANAMLGKNADFHATKFLNGGAFFQVKVFGHANFARSHFVEDSIFFQAYFNDTASFLNAKFDGPAFFNDTLFCKDADFDNAQFMAPADMSYAVFEGNLKLNSTKIARMVFEGSVFRESSHLYLAKADINRLMVSWSQIQNIISFDTSAYLSLIKNYKDLGQGNDANECYYEYRYLNQVHKPIGFSKLLDMLAWISCGYGVRPHYALLCGMVIILLFSFIYRIGRGVEGFHDIHGHQLMIASLFYSTIAFTANSKGLPLRGHYKYLGIAEGIVGWLLMALFLVTLGRLIIG